LRVRVRGLGSRQVLHLTLMEEDGTSWSAALPVDSTWSEKTIPLAALSVGRGVLLPRSEEHTSELQSRGHLVCRLLLEKKNQLHVSPTTIGRLRETPPKPKSSPSVAAEGRGYANTSGVRARRVVTAKRANRFSQLDLTV